MRWISYILPAVFLNLQAWAANFAALETFTYRNQAEAERSWRAIDHSPRVIHSAAGLILPCPFAQDRDRVYWDRDVSLDLSPYTSLELDVSCEKPEALRSLAIYLRSGNGWYVWNRPLRDAGRNRISLPRAQFSVEGKPAGWNKIDRIRISPWKGAAVDTQLILYSLAARKDSLFIVKASLSTKDAGERAMSERLANRISRWLTELSISHTVISEDEAARGKLANARWVILPLNPDPPASVMGSLRNVIENGGHLLVCFSASDALADLMHVKLGAYASSEKPGRWEAMDFSRAAGWRVPQRVYQSSWNIRPVSPASDDGAVIARWVNASGELLEDPAWVATDRGLWMSHVLLEDDTFNKEQMLLGLLARYDKTLWYEAARGAMTRAGKIDGFAGVEGAIAGITKISGGDERVAGLLQEARKHRNEMTTQFNVGNYSRVVELEQQVRRALTDAFASCQRPKSGELRGVWDHDGTGWFPGDWNKTAQILSESGINAIFPNMLWAGLAHYRSEVVPASVTARLYGDQMKACLEAARKYGLKVHAWKICWNVEQAPDEFVAGLKKSGRLLKSKSGDSLPWLDPARADNQDLELAAIRELVEKYELDGLHLDYIRYPPGASEKNAWAITEFVRKVRDEVKAIRPGIQLSAAVWGTYPSCVQAVGQDWATWLKNGYVDFVVPMNYTPDRHEFASLLRKQLALPNARGRIYAGIGVSAAESQLRADDVIEQILTLRELNVPGFVLFDMSHPLLDDSLPMLRKGITGGAEN